MIRRLQPNALIINNTGLSARGELGHPEIDSVTFEQGLAEMPDRSAMEKYVAGEMCCTLNDHWGFGKNDLNYKSPAELIRQLCRCRRAGANFLLNVGPDGSGAAGREWGCSCDHAGEPADCRAVDAALWSCRL